MNNAELKLEVVSPTTIKCGHIEWFALDTKLVGKVKVLLEENEELKKVNKNLLLCNFESDDKINAVIDDLKHFHLIYNEDGKLITSDKSIFAQIRFFIDKLEGTIPTTMTPFEHDMWERENRNNEGEDDEKQN